MDIVGSGNSRFVSQLLQQDGLLRKAIEERMNGEEKSSQLIRENIKSEPSY